MPAQVITITSGKGGVGKTTAVANIAVALASGIHRVRLLGPSRAGRQSDQRQRGSVAAAFQQEISQHGGHRVSKDEEQCD